MPKLSNSGPARGTQPQAREGQHAPDMFVRLFIETDPDDLLAEEDRRPVRAGPGEPGCHGPAGRRP